LPRARQKDAGMVEPMVSQGREQLSAIVAAVEAGELLASSAELAALHGGLAVLVSLDSVQQSTV
jgi:hypothetical protein